MRRSHALAVLVAALAAVIGVGFLSGGGGSPSKLAPALPNTVLRPPVVNLAQLRGHPVLVNFWASWCHPCMQEAPQLQRFAAQEHGLQLVSVDTGDSAAAARSFIRRYGWTFPVLRDPDNTVGGRYGIVGLPTTFVLSGRGRIVSRLIGPQTSSSLERALRSAG